MDKQALFEKIFGSDENDGELLLDQGDKKLAAFVFNVACEQVFGGEEDSDDEADYVDSDTYSVLSFEEKVSAAVENFERVVELFKKTRRAKNNFLNNFEAWSPGCKENIELLKNCAEAIQTDKFNSDISKVVGGVVGAIGGIAFGLSFLTPLAVVTVPLAIGGGVASTLGATVVTGTSITEFALMKKKLDEAKELVKKEQEAFSAMSHWFTYPEELKKAIEALLSYDLLKEMAQDLNRFFDGVRHKTNITIGQFKEQFKEMLKRCLKKMQKDSKINCEFGDEIAPFVMTFVFVVCLMKGQNRIILDCVMITQRLALGLNVLDLGVKTGRIFAGLAMKGATNAGESLARFAIMEVIVTLGVVLDLLTIVLSSIDLHKRPETKVTKKINEAIEQLEKAFIFIENVYNEVKKYKSISPADVSAWTTIVVNSVPEKAEPEDIKTAVQTHLPEEAWGCIKLKRLPTSGNNWFIKVPATHSQNLFLLTDLTIKEERCQISH